MSIKSLMDDIIKDTDKRYSDDPDCYEKFDKEGFREKLSFFVIKDIISSMMKNDTTNLDKMIDDSIMDHIKNDYKGTCYGYLCAAKNKCKSPLLADVIQEIEETTEAVKMECESTKNKCVVEAADVKEMLKGVEDYDQFVEKLAATVSEKVVDDVAGLIATQGGAQAPTFSNLDDKIEVKAVGDAPEENVDTADSTNAEPIEGVDAGATEGTEGEDSTPEVTTATDANATPSATTESDDMTVPDTPAAADTSAPTPSVDTSVDTSAIATPASGAEVSTESSVILTMCGNIVLESALSGVRMSTDEGIERAIVQFCLAEMDHLFKQPSTVYARYYHS